MQNNQNYILLLNTSKGDKEWEIYNSVDVSETSPQVSGKEIGNKNCEYEFLVLLNESLGRLQYPPAPGYHEFGKFVTTKHARVSARVKFFRSSFRKYYLNLYN